MKVSHSRTTNWRFSSWWGILVLIKINGGSPIWSMIYSGEWSQFKAIGSLKWYLLHPYHHLIFVFHSENSLKNVFFNNIYIFIFYTLYFQFKSVGDLLTSNYYQDFKLLDPLLHVNILVIGNQIKIIFTTNICCNYDK